MRRRWWILVAVSLATFMTYLDNNVTNVAIPTIQRDLHLSIAGLEWVVSSYILVFASLLLFGGRMADLFGQRRLFMIGLSVFTVSSLAAGLAGSGTELIGARLVQGIGAALLVPTTLAIILATFDNVKERTTAIGVWTAIGAMALAFGPLIGGFISQHVHWGWIFFINVPIGAITLAIAVPAMQRIPRHQRRAQARPARPRQFRRGAVRAHLRADRGPRQGLDLGADHGRVRRRCARRPPRSSGSSRARSTRWWR